MKTSDATLHPPLTPVFFIGLHKDFVRTSVKTFPIPDDGKLSGILDGAHWSASFKKGRSAAGRDDVFQISFRVDDGVLRGVTVGLCWEIANWTKENYVLLPGAVYAGNRFDALRRPYPPEARNIGQAPHSPVLDIGDLPRLNISKGTSHLSQLSVDCAIPGLGVYFPNSSEALIILTKQETEEYSTYHFEVVESEDRESATIYWSAPGFIPRFDSTRDAKPAIGDTSAAYLHPENIHPADLGPGATITLEGLITLQACEDVHALFSSLLTLRDVLDTEPPQPCVLSFSNAFDLIHRKYEADNWDEHHGLYKVGIPWMPKQDSQFWQNGWLGGGIPIVPFAELDDETVRTRVYRNFDFFLRKGISDLGLFKAIMSPEGRWFGDGYGDWDGGSEPRSLTRRSGDGLFFACRMLLYLRAINRDYPAEWDHLVEQAASALCGVWKRHHDWGFLINYDTGDVVIGGTTSGALIPAGLVLASRLFDGKDYLVVAQQAVAQFCFYDLARGVTAGGPGDAVQAPDSESVSALLESIILLYEETGDSAWLVDARHAASQLGSWVLSYKHRFPKGSAMDEIHIDTRGTILANAQNKCAVPGICTLSGEGLLRLFRYTGDRVFLDLIASISNAIPQFVSTRERPIPARITWGHPDKTHLPEGWICERVNMSPWWYEPIGEQAAYSCWCEVAMLLTWNDLPGVYAQSDTGLIKTMDHVSAAWRDEKQTVLVVSNPLSNEVTVKVMIETSKLAALPLPANFGMFLPRYTIGPGESIEVYAE